jgi:hypothetical protein
MGDTMGSTETDSTPELHKLYVDDDVCAVCAGNVEFGSEVISLLKQELKELPSRRHGLIYEALNKAVHEHRMNHFRWDIIATRYSFTPGAILESQQQAVVDEWQQYDSGIQLLVSVFHHSGLALLFYVGRIDGVNGWVHSCQFPGYFTIGTGGYNALSWLHFRRQQLGLNPKQSAYHSYEAKIMGSSAPTVNKRLDIGVAFADQHYLLTEEHPEADGCPISLTELVKMYEKYGPQDTNDLGHPIPKPSASRKSKREP